MPCDDALGAIDSNGFNFDLARPDSRISHQAGTQYWSSQPASVSGMLGGIPQVSKVDLQGSKNFFAKMQRRTALGKRRRGSDEGIPSGIKSNDTPQKAGVTNGEKNGEAGEETKNGESSRTLPIERAADCGAGIGRVTLGFLSTIATTIDIVEPIAKFTEEISTGEPFAFLRAENRVGTIQNKGLESWNPKSNTYGLIWHQWCLGQLTDTELIAYLKRAKRGLKEDGWIGVKENVIGGEFDDFDATDSTVTRCLKSWRQMFAEAGLKMEMEEVQKGFPRGLFAVRMWALRPV
ncbi:MAG: hypothetical protein Q9159_001590 [Coniocarpon cinnabarinum]